MWARPAQRACVRALASNALPRRWSARAPLVGMPSQPFQRLGLLHTDKGPVTARIRQAEKAQSDTLKVVDELFDHVAESATRDVHSSSHSSPLVMRDLHASPWLPPQDTAAQQPDAQAKSKLGVPQTKTMEDSYTCFDLRFSESSKLLEKYLNTSGGLRIGLLLEHIDSLAGAIAYRHCLPSLKASNGQSDEANALDSSGMMGASALLSASHDAGIYIATASVDRLDLFKKLGPEEVQDLRFSGFCTYVGKSSMEVLVKMSGLGKDGKSKPETLMLGRFSMVCRDAHTHKAHRVPSLKLHNKEEEHLYALGDDRKNRKKDTSLAALDRVPPTTKEISQLHALMLETREAQESGGGVITIAGSKHSLVPMARTELSSVNLIQPQDRNLHGKAFGGLLMRLAFELAFVTSTSFASRPMRFLALDQINFKLPVPIGAILHLDAKVVKTTEVNPEDHADSPSESAHAAKAHVVVTAQVEDVASGTRQTTNDFYFSFATEKGEDLDKMVIPETYQEAMLYLEGARRLEVATALRKLYKM